MVFLPTEDDMTDANASFDRLVEEAFPGDPLAKYHSGITFHLNGDIDVSYKGVTKRIYTAAPLPQSQP